MKNKIVIGIHGSIIIHFVMILERLGELTALNYVYFSCGTLMLGYALLIKDKKK